MSGKVCCFTGHRALPEAELRPLWELLVRTLRALADGGVREFCAGGALGFDTLAAEAVLMLREERPELRLTLVLPCRDQAARWRPEEVRRYERIKREADAVEYHGERYAPGCMQRRNRYMVDRSSLVLAVYDGMLGGTMYTLTYAMRQGVRVVTMDLDGTIG